MCINVYKVLCNNDSSQLYSNFCNKMYNNARKLSINKACKPFRRKIWNHVSKALFTGAFYNVCTLVYINVNKSVDFHVLETFYLETTEAGLTFITLVNPFK